MILGECRKKYRKLRNATLCFLIKNDEVLLAMKKRGFGMGKWNGVGGKQNEGELIEDAMIRETQEEISVKVRNFLLVAEINFYFPEKPDWNQLVHVYLSDIWDGDPQETEEMAPKWFAKKELPFSNMWSDDKFWLPDVLSGKNLKADFVFDLQNKVLAKNVVKIS